MFIKILIYTLFFYFLILLQTTFLADFAFCNFINLILISVIMINLFEKPKDWTGIYAAFIAGFFWDIFSAGFIGQYALILMVLSLFIKIVRREYV